MGAEAVSGKKAVGSQVSALNDVKVKLDEVLMRLYRHDGYGHCEVDMRILKRGQKEIIIRCGEEYRFVVSDQ